MSTPTVEDFRALARSSPWLWATLRFTVHWRPESRHHDAVRAWLRRPDSLRVETLDGGLVQVVREPRRQVGVLTSDGGRTVELLRVADPGAPAPERRPDGLLARRPSSGRVSYDDPMFQDYAWVAMLDPVELADGRDPDSGQPGGRALEVDSVTPVVHGGRPAWEAVVRTTDRYEPRCGCCPLLRSRRVDELEWGGPRLDDYPGGYRVRLDVGTGVCVRTEAVGGSIAGREHEVLIEAVDDPMGDGLFVQPRSGLFGRRRDRRPAGEAGPQ